MKQGTAETLESILEMVVSTPIPVRWRSARVMPGGGDRKSFFRGSSGYDILARVEYEPGDDPRDIDWAATAQTGGQTVYVTQYMEPRDLNVSILADVNPTMDFGTHRTTKRILAAELAGSVIKAATKTHDRVGFRAYNKHDIVAERRATGAHSAMFPVLSSLIEADGTTGDTTNGAGSGLSKALLSLPRSRSLVFVISDFLTVSEEEGLALEAAALQHDVICLVVRDLREQELPSGWGLYTLNDLASDSRQSVWLTRRTRRAFAENQQRQQEELSAFFDKVDCEFAVFSTEEGAAALTRVMQTFAGHRK